MASKMFLELAKNNPRFELAVYTPRLHIDDWQRTDLVTRDGRPVKVTKIDGTHAEGLLEGKPVHWWYSFTEAGKYNFAPDAPAYHVFCDHADLPGVTDVLLPAEQPGFSYADYCAKQDEDTSK